MKKLKIKVFSVIFSLLTLFAFIIISFSATTNYLNKKNSISKILNDISRPITRNSNKDRVDDSNVSYKGTINKEEPRKIYLDFTIYTIILDGDGHYQELVNHTNNDEINESDIKVIANNIIQNHQNNFYIGNLFVNKYSYVFTSNNTLIIMDNTTINKALINQLISAILIFIICEIVIFIVTYLITKWIINPVEKSFENQKIFVADASHELKTPLSVIIASSEAYFLDKDDKWVYNIKNESERMIKLVTELLDLAKTEHEQDVVMETYNLTEIIESSILTYESLFYERKIKLEYHLEENIDFLCNPDNIKELMSILIDNSIKYSLDDGHVIVNLNKKNKQIVLEVKNKGLPIKREDEEKIFERFYKVDSSRNRDSNNYGLGLAIAKNIVLKHNGKITARSYNGYTTFKVTWNQK